MSFELVFDESYERVIAGKVIDKDFFRSFTNLSLVRQKKFRNCLDLRILSDSERC
jgi:hypothetical protein